LQALRRHAHFSINGTHAQPRLETGQLLGGNDKRRPDVENRKIRAQRFTLALGSVGKLPYQSG
jgi:hypothetical protein